MNNWKIIQVWKNLCLTKFVIEKIHVQKFVVKKIIFKKNLVQKILYSKKSHAEKIMYDKN